MPQFQRRLLELMLSEIQEKASSDWIQKLPELHVSGARVAHFGCAVATETLALIWVLDAIEAYGIDRDISRAEVKLALLKDWMSESSAALPYTSSDNYLWWKHALPAFLREGRYPHLVQEQDVAHPTKPYQLPESHFDIACCSNLLCQIHDSQGEDDVRQALEEMRRVVRIGGWLVVDEPDNGISARYLPLIERCFEAVRAETYDPGQGWRATTYYCQRQQ